MKKVLIATTNKDKYDTVCKIFRETIFPIDIYIIEKLTEDMKIPEKEEIGNNVETARTKALNAYNHLKNHNYGYIVGIDDAIKIKNKVDPNIKKILNKILFENYLNDGEEFSFNRAFCIINKQEKIYETVLNTPYIYKHSFKF